MDDKGQSIGGGLIAIAIVFVAIIVFLVLIVGGWTVIPAGAVGVQDTFGNVDSNTLNSGFHLKNPMTGVITFDSKTQKFEADDIIANTKERLEVTVHITVNYRIDPSKANDIYKNIGADYREKVLYPLVRSTIYEQVGQYTAEQLYADRNTISAPTRERVNQELASRGIIVESVLVRGLPMPPTLKQAIEDKLTMDQNVQKKLNEVRVEEAEKKRKIVQAEGIAEANRIIAGSLSDPYLTWYWIENVAGKNNTIYVPMNGMTPVKAL